MTKQFRTLDEVDVKGKRVLLRVDLNVPMENGRVTDATRLERVAPTITELSAKGGKVILLAHFGRPKGRDPKDSLKPVVAALSQAIDMPVAFADDCIGEVAQNAVAAMKDGDILCLENTRFHKEEENNDQAFVAELAKLGDIWVNDAFSAAHRAHASTEGLGHKLPAYAGRTLQAELDALGKALEVADQAGDRDHRRRQGLNQDRSAAEPRQQGRSAGDRRRHGEHVPACSGPRHRQIIGGKAISRRPRCGSSRRRAAVNCAIILPVDAVVAQQFAANALFHAYGLDAVPAGGMILDIGPQSIAQIEAAIDNAATLVWNGPLGAFEMTPFDHGTVMPPGTPPAGPKPGS